MTIEFDSIPGFKKDARRSFVYVQCDDFSSFRKFFTEIEILLGAPRPKSGSLMNKETQLVTPAKETYCAIAVTGDHEAWKKVIEVYCRSVGVNTAYVEGAELVVSNGGRVPLSLCTLESSHGR